VPRKTGTVWRALSKVPPHNFGRRRVPERPGRDVVEAEMPASRDSTTSFVGGTISSRARARLRARTAPAPAWRVHADRLVVFVLAIALWQFCSLYFGAIWFSSPWRVLARFIAEVQNGELFFNTVYTVKAAFYGSLLGGIPGALLPFVLRRRPLTGAVLDPYLAGGYGVPKLALAPLFILWFGVDLEPKVALVASIVSFVVFFSTTAGVNAVNAQYVSVARVFGAKERDIARHIVWPGAIPYAFAGFRIAAPYAIGAAVVGELISSNRGLGFMINSGATDFDTTLVFVALVTLTMLVVAINLVVARAERWLLRWRPPQQQGFGSRVMGS
jgi:NitT/TauT family transport system permease protein